MSSPIKPRTSLSSLRHTRLEPRASNGSTHKRVFLQSIEDIQVTGITKQSGVKVIKFVIFVRRGSCRDTRLLSSQSAPEKSKANIRTRIPDFEICQPMDAFTELVSDLYKTAYANGSDLFCETCGRVVDFVIFRHALPSAWERTFSREPKLLAKLTIFLQETHQVVIDSIQSRSQCENRQQRVDLLYNFFRQ